MPDQPEEKPNTPAPEPPAQTTEPAGKAGPAARKEATPAKPEAPAGRPAAAGPPAAKPEVAKPSGPAAKPAPAKPAPPPQLTPLEMIDKDLRALLEQRLQSGNPVTIQTKEGVFTGRIFRLMLHEGWAALEHVDGRRKAMYLITGGKLTDDTGVEVELPS